MAVAGRRLLVLGDLGDQRIGREQQGRHARRVLQGGPHHLRRVDDAGAHEVAVLTLVGVVAVVLALHLPDTVDHHRAVGAGILGDRGEGIPEGISHDRGPELLVPLEVELLDRLLAVQQGHTATRHDALGEGRLHGTLGVVDQGLPLLHLGLRGRAHVDLGHAPGELGEPLLELLTVVVAGGLRDLVADLGHAAVDRRLPAGAADDRGVFRLHDHLLGPAEVAELDGVEGDAEILEDRLTAGEHGDVTEHRLAAVAVAGSLHGHRLDDAPQLVDDERGQGLPLDVLGDHHQRLARLADGLEERHEVLRARDLLLEDEDGRVFELAHLSVGVGDEVGREIATVELHALDHVHRGLGLLAFLDGDHAVLAHLEKRLGEHVADRGIVVAGDRGDLHQLLLVLLVDRRRHREHRLRDGLDRLVDPAGEGHRVGTRGDHLDPLAEDRLGEHRGRGRAVARHVVRLAGRLLHQLRAEVLERVLEIDLFGDGHTVLGDLGRAPALVEHGVAAAGTERALHGTGKLGDAGEQRLTGLVVEHHLFGHGRLL